MTTKETFQAIFDSLPDAVIITNESGIIQMVNNQVKNVFGYNPSELLHKEVEVLIPNNFQLQHRVHREKFISAPKTREMGDGRNLTALCKDGTEIAVEVSLSHLQVNKNNIVLASIRDVTGKRQLANQLGISLRELEAKNVELEQFAYIVSHDLQEPLRTLSGLVTLMENLNPNKLNTDVQIYIRYISEVTNRMRGLVKGILDYSILGKELNIQNVDLNIVIERIKFDLSAQINERSARIDCKHLPIVRVHEATIGTLFQNLISNGLKFNREGIAPHIIVSVEKEKSEWVFSIEDNGIGLDKKFANKIFGIFQRLHSRSEYPGSGIGLAHCKKIVEFHGGRIWVESDGNSGSRFYFTLPE